MPSTEAVDALVHTVIVVMSAAFTVAVIVGAACLARTYTGGHRSPYQAADIGHQPRHARPVAPSRLVRLLDAYLTSTREAASAYAVLTGAQPWYQA